MWMKMIRKKKHWPLAGVTLCLCAALCACGAPGPGSSGAENTETSGGEARMGPPALVMAAQIYEGDSVIEVPQFENSRQSGVLDSLNARMLEFAGDYERYAESGGSDGGWLELKCYPLLDEKYAQIVLTRAVYPSYGDYGEIAGFCYDWQTDAEVTLEEMAAANGMDLSSPDRQLTDALPKGEFEAEFDRLEPAASVISQLGNVDFFSVYFKPPEANEDPRRDLYVRYPDGSYEFCGGDVLPFGPLEVNLLRGMDPPLYYASR